MPEAESFCLISAMRKEEMTEPNLRDDPPGGSQRLNREGRWTILACAALIGILAAQPALVSRYAYRQSAFAWEMYSKAAARDEFQVVSPTANEIVTVTDVQPRGLASVDYTGVLPEFICTKRPETSEVRVFRADLLIRVHKCGP